MLWIDQVAGDWWLWVFHASLQLAALIVIVAVLGALLRSRSALLMHWLWVIVLVKAFLPPYVQLSADSIPWLASALPEASVFATSIDYGFRDSTQMHELGKAAASRASIPVVTLMLAIWVIGLIAFWLIVIRNQRKVTRSLQSAESVDEGALRVAYERVALSLGVVHCPDLKVTDMWTSPFLVGMRNPCVVLPKSIVRNASEQDIAVVMAHELVHFKRADTWVGWLQVLALSIFWFHPFFWWAMRQLRQSREEACDETVLRQTSIAAEDYGDAMLRLVTRSQAKSLVGVGLVGVFERSTQFQIRLEKVMTFNKNKTAFGVGSKLFVALIGLTLLPMPLIQVTKADEQSAGSTEEKAKSPVPRIVSTEPEVGATEVKSSTSEIRVTFDRDMRTGMSWTGSAPYLPPKGDGKPRWIDKRTCVLPVKLEQGKFYRVGINSTSFNNFKSTDGVAASPSAIYFATEGAPADVIALAKTPEIVKLEPANGANDVDPSLDAVTVTFNMPMDDGMSWTGGGPEFPTLVKDKKATWSEDKLTCTLPVSLQAGKKYQLGLNSKSHKNFQSEGGVPLESVKYSFTTK